MTEANAMIFRRIGQTHATVHFDTSRELWNLAGCRALRVLALPWPRPTEKLISTYELAAKKINQRHRHHCCCHALRLSHG